MFTLRPYQQDAVDATLTHFRKTDEPAVIVLPTGAGKSLVIAELARLAKRKILILTHVKELVEQNHSKFCQYADERGIKSGVYSAGLNLKQTEQQVTFASVQSVVRNLAAFEAEYSLVIIDECHRVSDDEEGQYGQIINKLKQQNSRLKILGLTATPYRMGMGWIYQFHYYGIKRTDEKRPFTKCIYELPLGFMINQGYLTKPILVDAPVAQYDFSALASNRNGEFNENEVNELLVKYPRVTQAIIEQVVEQAGNRQGVMIFAATIKHATEIAGYLPPEQTALITGKTKLKERDHLINQFKAKQIKYLVNVSVLTTGFDAPHVDVIAILRPTESISLYQQIVGRGLRLNEGKTDCLITDYAGNGINIFYPEIGEKKPNGDSELVQVFCPACGFANAFWGIKDSENNVIEHYGRKCQGVFEDEGTGEREECDYRFRFKECGQCNAQNDIAARVCHQCQHDLVDPDEKLKAALQLKGGLVLRCSGITLAADNERLKVTYYDEDGVAVNDWYDFTHTSKRKAFNNEYGKRFLNGTKPTEFDNVKQVIENQQGFTAPDFVIARKWKKGFKVEDKVFDYQGNYRKANQLN